MYPLVCTIYSLPVYNLPMRFLPVLLVIVCPYVWVECLEIHPSYICTAPYRHYGKIQTTFHSYSTMLDLQIIHILAAPTMQRPDWFKVNFGVS